MKNIKSVFEKHIKDKRLTGAACVVARQGKIIYKDVWGYTDCRQTKKLEENHIFRLASMTKPITAVAVMICKERNLLSLDEPISNYLSDFHHAGVGKLENGEPIFIKNARELTLRDILTHSSGLGSGALGDFYFSQTKIPNKLEENVRAWNGRFLEFSPGDTANYSGVVAFELAALIVEKVSGKTFESFLQEEIFNPLGMKDTCYQLSEEQISRLVEMPLPDNNGAIKRVDDLGLRGFGAYECGYIGGSAGLFSTLDDYYSFAQMLCNKGELNGKRILSSKSVNEMATVSFDGGGWWNRWGLSVYVRTEQNENQPLPIGSYGWSGAYGTHFWVEPKEEVVALLMLNHGNCGGSSSPFSAEFEKLVEKGLE